MKILVVSTVVFAASMVMGVAYGKTVSLSPLGVTEASATVDGSDTVKVQGRGVGATKAAALKDAYRDGEEIGAYPWQIPNNVLINVKFAEAFREDQGSNGCVVYATPFVGCFGECLIQWRDFVLKKDDLAKIA